MYKQTIRLRILKGVKIATVHEVKSISKRFIIQFLF